MLEKVLNIPLVTNPINWVTVALILLIGGLFLTAIMPKLTGSN